MALHLMGIRLQHDATWATLSFMCARHALPHPDHPTLMPNSTPYDDVGHGNALFRGRHTTDEEDWAATAGLQLERGLFFAHQIRLSYFTVHTMFSGRIVEREPRTNGSQGDAAPLCNHDVLCPDELLLKGFPATRSGTHNRHQSRFWAHDLA